MTICTTLRRLVPRMNRLACALSVMGIVVLLLLMKVTVFVPLMKMTVYVDKPPPDANELNKFFAVIPRETGQNSTNIGPKENLNKFSYPINEENLCRRRENKDIVMLVAVYAAVKEIVERDYVRSTWGAVAKKNPKLRIIFIVGLPEDPKLNIAMQNESSVYHDIIQANFTDTYRNLMFKSFALFHWVTRHCAIAKYVLKIDSDMHIDLEPLLHNLETLSVPSAFLCGAIWPYAQVFRNKDSKWYVSESEYPFQKYPRYCSGPAFILPQRIVRKFSALSVPREPFPVDDVFITGMLRTMMQEEAVGGLFSFSLSHENKSDYHSILSNGNHIKKVQIL